MTRSPQPITTAQAEQLVSRFLELYQTLDHSRLHRLGEIYHPQVRFIDPLHQIDGLTALTRYFEGLYQNLVDCHIEVNHQLLHPQEAALYWTMTLTHPRLNGGRPFALEGHSHLMFTDTIHYHRDYFDAGQMLYEQLPLLRNLVRAVKRRVGS